MYDIIDKLIAMSVILLVLLLSLPVYTISTANAAVIVGEKRDDIIKGSNGNDVIVGLAGNDRLNGSDGLDIIIGGSGDDILDGGPGNDKISGGRGNDILIGGPGNDSFNCGSGQDKILDFNPHEDVLREPTEPHECEIH
jgi:Ca2+-binding RTX toxin-like protein